MKQEIEIEFSKVGFVNNITTSIKQIKYLTYLPVNIRDYYFMSKISVEEIYKLVDKQYKLFYYYNDL